MIAPFFAAAGQAASSFFGGAESAGPLVSGGGTFAPGGITIGSRVVGSGSAATTVPAAAGPGVTASAVPGAATATAGAGAWWQSPLVWLIAGAVVVGLFLFAPSRR